MGLKTPPTSDPTSNVRKPPASSGKMNAVGNETSANMADAFDSSDIGPGSKKNAGGGSNMSFNSGSIHEALK